MGNEVIGGECWTWMSMGRVCEGGSFNKEVRLLGETALWVCTETERSGIGGIFKSECELEPQGLNLCLFSHQSVHPLV